MKGLLQGRLRKQRLRERKRERERLKRDSQRRRLGRANRIKDNLIEVTGWAEWSSGEPPSLSHSRVDPFIIMVHAKLDPSSANTSFGSFYGFSASPVVRIISGNTDREIQKEVIPPRSLRSHNCNSTAR